MRRKLLRSLKSSKHRAAAELRYLRLRDYLDGIYKGHFGFHRRSLKRLNEQKKSWDGAYVQGYFYQGLEELGIMGAKPTGHRFRQYDVDDILEGADVLDIGSNTGFVAIHCAKFADKVVGIEFNPYLIDIAKDAAEHLGYSNVEFVTDDFASYESGEKYDVVLSLSNHHTIDGNLDIGFEGHIRRIADLLNDGGIMLFESHNVFGPGVGGVGDDGDMDRKMQIIAKHFCVERYRMVRKFLKFGDVDKLFIVTRKCADPSPVEFDLETARVKYDWTIVDAGVRPAHPGPCGSGTSPPRP